MPTVVTPETATRAAELYLDLMKKCLTYSLWEGRDGAFDQAPASIGNTLKNWLRGARPSACGVGSGLQGRPGCRRGDPGSQTSRCRPCQSAGFPACRRCSHRRMPRVVARVSGFELQRGLVASGHGVAVAYTRPAADRSYDGANLAVRPITEAIPPQKILLVHNPISPPTRACEAVMDCAISWFKRHRGRPETLLRRR